MFLLHGNRMRVENYGKTISLKATSEILLEVKSAAPSLVSWGLAWLGTVWGSSFMASASLRNGKR